MFSATWVRKLVDQSSTRPPEVVQLGTVLKELRDGLADAGWRVRSFGVDAFQQALQRQNCIDGVDCLLVEGEIGAALLPASLRPIQLVIAVVAPTGGIIPVAGLREQRYDIGLRVGIDQVFA